MRKVGGTVFASSPYVRSNTVKWISVLEKGKKP